MVRARSPRSRPIAPATFRGPTACDPAAPARTIRRPGSMSRIGLVELHRLHGALTGAGRNFSPTRSGTSVARNRRRHGSAGRASSDSASAGRCRIPGPDGPSPASNRPPAPPSPSRWGTAVVDTVGGTTHPGSRAAADRPHTFVTCTNHDEWPERAEAGRGVGVVRRSPPGAPGPHCPLRTGPRCSRGAGPPAGTRSTCRGFRRRRCGRSARAASGQVAGTGGTRRADGLSTGAISSRCPPRPDRLRTRPDRRFGPSVQRLRPPRGWLETHGERPR